TTTCCDGVAARGSRRPIPHSRWAARRRHTIASAALVVSLARAGHAEPQGRLATPLDGLGADVRDAFTGTPLLLDAAAVVSTGALAWSGADHQLRVEIQNHL